MPALLALATGQEDGLTRPRGASRHQLLFWSGAAGVGALGLPALLAAGGADDEEGQTTAEAAKAAGGGGKFHAVTQAVPGDPWAAVFRTGMEDAAEDFGVEVADQAPEEFSIEKQVSLLESAIAARRDGLMVGIARSGSARGIPVVAVTVPDPRGVDDRIPYLFYVGGDEELSGRACASRRAQHRACFAACA